MTAAKKWAKRIGAVVTGLSAILGVLTGGGWIYEKVRPEREIRLQLEDNDIVPHCLVLRGSAPHWDGMTLVEAHHSAAGRYYFNRTVRTQGDHFTMTSNIGGDSATGQAYVLEVFYLPDETAHFVLGIDGVGETGAAGQGYAVALPPGAESIERRMVRRSEKPDPRRC